MSTEHPILFSGEMVRAILAGRKTQTRRVIKPQPHTHTYQYDKVVQVGEWFHIEADEPEPVMFTVKCPYGRPGDLLWVREMWQKIYERQSDKQRFTEPPSAHNSHLYKTWIEYAASPRDEHEPPRWRPSIHMPRAASRITLEVVNVRVERLNDISEVDAKAEGIQPSPLTDIQPYRAGFCGLWDTLNEKRGFGWLDNPWVWVVEFKRVTP